MRIHFVAIGGSAMHNLAIALKQKGYSISGSDDEIFEPSRSRLQSHGLLPSAVGWFPERITRKLDAIVLGMHARADNPELIRAKELGLKIFSYPEYLYEQTQNKTRVVIGGSHGKTTITSMVMHVLRNVGVDFDFMVGAQLEGFTNMVSLCENTPVAVFEGDEYLTSPIDLRPKFHLYKPTIALLSGIAWDHINAFPTFDTYRRQFEIFVDTIEPNGALIFCSEDAEVARIVQKVRPDVRRIPYMEHPSRIEGSNYVLQTEQGGIPVQLIGGHNMQNISGAQAVCSQLGVSNADFYRAIATFSGAAKRLQLLAQNGSTRVYLDFAHSPSKVGATVRALRQAYPEQKLVACLELHTFSSLTANFLEQYNGALQGADVPIVFFDAHTIEHKKLPPLENDRVSAAFGNPKPMIFNAKEELKHFLDGQLWRNCNLLLMTSGNFAGMELNNLASAIVCAQ